MAGVRISVPLNQKPHRDDEETPCIVHRLGEDYQEHMPETDPLALQVGMALVAAASARRGAGMRMMNQLGLGHIARFRFLRTLWFAPRHRLLPCDLAEALAVTTPTVTAMVDGLEKDGLVTRLPNERDRRSNIIALTEKGEDACATMMPRSAGIAVQACAGFTEEEKQTLAALLLRYWQNLPDEGEY